MYCLCLLLWGVPNFLVHTGGFLAIVFRHSSNGENFAAVVGQQTLPGSHPAPSACLRCLGATLTNVGPLFKGFERSVASPLQPRRLRAMGRTVRSISCLSGNHSNSFQVAVRLARHPPRIVSSYVRELPVCESVNSERLSKALAATASSAISRTLNALSCGWTFPRRLLEKICPPRNSWSSSSRAPTLQASNAEFIPARIRSLRSGMCRLRRARRYRADLLRY